MASTPFQNCPRCLLRERAQVPMVLAPAPRRFGRNSSELDRVTEAKSRLVPGSRRSQQRT